MRSPCVFVTILAGSLLCGCGHGLIGPLPIISNQNNAAEVFVLRGYQLRGHGESAYVSFDNNEFLAIRVAEYTKFLAPAGNHTISVKTSDGLGNTISILLTPKEKSYFRVTAQRMGFFMGFQIEPISETEAGPYLAEDIFLPLDKTTR